MLQDQANLTPMIRQYLDIKKDYQDSILFFRMGDFYEMFFEDALKASPILEIALTSRNKGEGNAIPLCGVPHHSATSYVARLIQAGLKVAICEQVEDPQSAKGIVKREVVRVITPGVVLEAESLDAKTNNYLASLSIHQDQVGLSLVDISTGEMQVGFYANRESFLSEFNRKEPREILCSEKDAQHPFILNLKNHFPAAIFYTYDFSSPAPSILEGFSARFQDAWKNLGLEKISSLAEHASLRLLSYLHKTLKNEAGHLHQVHWVEEGTHLLLDAATIRNLELIKNRQDGNSWGTLLQVLDKTKTPMGGRLLKKWILYPLMSLPLIKIRQQAQEELIENTLLKAKLREILAQVVDLERQNARVATGIAHARDLFAIGRTLALFPQVREFLQKLNSPFFKNLLESWQDLTALSEKILKTLREELPLSIREGNLLQRGVLAELDELHDILHDGKSVLAKMETEERAATGIHNLKLRYNRVFGYYLEVPQSKAANVPAHYLRKQTLVNAERFITPELKRYEEKVLGAEEKIRHLEYELFIQLRTEVSKFSHEISQMAHLIAKLDVIISLAEVAEENNYICPEFKNGEEYLLEESRHPVLEKLFPENRFVPNDISLNTQDSRLLLITGPNMAGKSTVLRQVAVLALMAHMGAFVPAKRAVLGLMDRIFTRIGASDNLSKNQSTFWVEMEETATILNSATQKSLVILDEIGRGTSTYDGLSIAWAVAEHLHDQIQAKTLFATHYHELTQLESEKNGVRNFHVAVKEWEGQILFLYRLLEGGVSRSYGIQVASLAGIPPSVTARAKTILKDLQEKGSSPSFSLSNQIPLFESGNERVLEEIRHLPLDSMTPIAAIQFLYDLQKKI